MKVRYYLLYGLTILLVAMSFIFIRAANANIIDTLHSTDLLVEARTKTKPLAEAKSPYQKYAKVYFITKKYNITSDAIDDGVVEQPILDGNCPSGFSLYQNSCEVSCDTEAYPYSSAPDAKKGAILEMKCVLNSALTTRYMYTRCNNGWYLTNHKCEVSQCSKTDYPYTSSPSVVVGELKSCKTGEDYRYGYASCYEGWDKSDGQCKVHTCSSEDYPYTSDPGGTAGKLKAACKTGEDYRYGYASCYEGWDKSGSQCIIHICNNTDYPYTSNPGSTAGTLKSVCKTGTDSRWGYSSCNDGWSKSGSQCIENVCSGYGSSSSSISYCNSSTSCQKGSNKVYKCSSCQSGYGVNSSGLCEVITCPTGQINIYTYWCSDAWRCLMPGG